MNDRFRKRSRFRSLPPVRTVGLIALLGFALFVSFRIFKAPEETVQRITAPDGSRAARLVEVYYTAEPGYKVSVKSGLLWRTLLYLPELPEEHAGKDVRLRWADDSARLVLEFGDDPVWDHPFE